MKYFYTLAALAALAAAQDTSIPSCAEPCIEDAISNETSCDVDDFGCACQNIDAVRNAATTCVVTECGADTALNEVIPAVEAICEAEAGNGDDDDDDDDDDATDAPETPEETPAPEPEPETPETPEETQAPEVPDEEDDHDDDDDDDEHYPPPAPTHGNETIPEPQPTHVETDGASQAGFMGVAAMIGLAAIAL